MLHSSSRDELLGRIYRKHCASPCDMMPDDGEHYLQDAQDLLSVPEYNSKSGSCEYRLVELLMTPPSRESASVETYHATWNVLGF
eukprot:scaffold1243_cov403-Prasinococcus_capsulatus_cf.AAC.14